LIPKSVVKGVEIVVIAAVFLDFGRALAVGWKLRK
jgi:hypothetical protein